MKTKQFAGVATAAIMITALAACGGGDAETAAPATVTETVTSEPVAETEEETSTEEETATEEVEETTSAPEPTEAVEETEEPTTEEPAEEEAEEETEADFGEAKTSDRGYLIKEIGQPAGIGDPDSGEMTVTFTLTDVVKDFECTSDPMMAEPPANGHYVAFEWEVETGNAEAMTEVFYDATFTLSEWDLTVLDADGKRLNDISGNAMWCPDSNDTLPTSIGPKQTASGLIVLDLAVTEGTLVIDGANWWIEGAGGWEWNF